MRSVLLLSSIAFLLLGIFWDNVSPIILDLGGYRNCPLFIDYGSKGNINGEAKSIQVQIEGSPPVEIIENSAQKSDEDAQGSFENVAPDVFFTEEELRKFDGSTSDTPIYLALNGDVFDVSKGRSYYGPGGSYGLFAGRICDRALAISKLEESELTDNLENIKKDEVEMWAYWVQFFGEKYPKVGKLDKDGMTDATVTDE
mmetsp:Transcript_2647/g.3827  ORF Transcript_2647/g.3827 Transcript_2647/m.3827 type:complete len:200 (-) Transcript_2647:74-673(-)